MYLNCVQFVYVYWLYIHVPVDALYFSTINILFMLSDSLLNKMSTSNKQTKY